VGYVLWYKNTYTSGTPFSSPRVVTSQAAAAGYGSTVYTPSSNPYTGSVAYDFGILTASTHLSLVVVFNLDSSSDCTLWFVRGTGNGELHAKSLLGLRPQYPPS
jgi:hypothetical protein